jgi:uncharacterized damage-inducible protein DinB
MNLVRMLGFDSWANNESLRAIRRGGPTQSVRVFSHIVAIHEFWLARALGQIAGDAWPELDLDSASDRLSTNHRRWVRLLSEMPQPESAWFEYVTSMGATVRNSYHDVVLELLCHGAHHRGQIAVLLRQAGYEPPASTDFIPALREGKF